MNAKTDTLSAQGRAALAYAGRGWRVFPVKPGQKIPIVKNGMLEASCDIETVRSWWRRWPDANIGLHLAASGLVAVDADIYKPDCGFSAFMQGRDMFSAFMQGRDMFSAFMQGRDMPETLVQKSARGGAHYIFLAEEGAEFPGKLCDGVDIKHKGYILL